MNKLNSIFARLQYFLLPLFFLIASGSSRAQIANFKTYSLDEGLSQSEVNCILEDNRGYLWLGTNGGGLCKFDGTHFQNYEEKDGLSGQIVTSVAEDSKGNIWSCSTWGGLCKYDGKKFRTFTSKDGLAGDRFDQMTIDDQDNIVLCTHGQISLFNGKKSWIISAKSNGMQDNDITCLLKDKKGNIWLGSKHGLFALKGQQLHELTNGPDLHAGPIRSITEDEDGNIWYVRSPQSLYKVNTSISPNFESLNAELVDVVKLPVETEISTIHFDRRNQLWMGTTNDGIYKFSKNNLAHFNSNNGLPNNIIKNILEDHSGCFWFGTMGGGMIKFLDQTFTYYDNLEGFKEGDVFGIAVDRSNNVWISSFAKGVFRFDGKQVTSFANAPELKNFPVRTIFCDQSGKIWMGGPKGIRQYDGHTFKNPGILPDTSHANVSAFTEDSYGNLWIGSRGQGAYRYDGKQTVSFREHEGLKNPYIYSICEDNSGNLWMGTGDGVYKYNHDNFQHYGTESGICNAYIGSITKDKFGTIWLGTDNCVAFFNGKTFQSVSTSDGLSSGTVYLLNVDDYGNIWVGTNKGVDKIILNKNGQIKMIRSFGKTEGFKGIECNSRSTCIDNDGNIWFGTIKGVIRYNPREERETDELPTVHITNVRLFYENTEWKNYSQGTTPWDNLPINTELPYDKNHITFDFKAINKTSPDNIKYSFMLKGFEADMCPETETPFATYSNLPPGTYTFIVKAANKNDNWNDIPAEFTFTIHKPFWGTWWFISICTLILIGLIYAYNGYRKKKQQAEKEELEKVINQRTSELIRQKEEKEVLLKEIHHRVKNNLQVINSLISIQSSFIEDEKSLEVFEECKNRIRTIALIHEKLYKSEDFGRINIKDYIQMLVQNLIETYNIDKNISLILDLKIEYLNLNTTVPLGLLLNEIISNSFKYAFKDMENGEIVIRLNTLLDSNSYVLIIGDNGSGYAGDPFKTSSSSLGLELVKILTEQLNGSIEKIPMDGTYYKMIFKSLKN